MALHTKVIDLSRIHMGLNDGVKSESNTYGLNKGDRSELNIKKYGQYVCMYVCMYVCVYLHVYLCKENTFWNVSHIHTCINRCKHIYIRIHDTYMHACIHTYMHAYMHANIHHMIRTYTCIHAYIHTCLIIYLKNHCHCDIFCSHSIDCKESSWPMTVTVTVTHSIDCKESSWRWRSLIFDLVM